LLLFTNSYPYEASLERNFIEPELPHLQRAFERVIVIPSRCEGRRTDVPSGIEVDLGLSSLFASYSARLKLLGATNLLRLFLQDIRGRPRLMRQPRALKRLLAAAALAALTRVWMRQMWHGRGLTPRVCVAYTFWCNHVTTGLALVKREYPDLIVVSRAHGHDLYAERHDPPYLPCREFTLTHLDRLLPDSDTGAEYVAQHYPWFATRCEVARMGVADPGFVATESAAGRCSVVSCSRVVPIKRVDLILRGIDCAARRRPEVVFEWHHFGEGELKAQIGEQARAAFPANATASFPGYQDRATLMHFYQYEPVDAFLNMSVSEGTPVSVMEAVSCGIPVIATAVGGNPEIVSNQSGALLDPDPSPDEIADALLDLIGDREAAAKKRRESRLVWKAKYDATATYEAFARLLSELRLGKRQP
jgi:glycosyltransferase involved in cell wall biosynthesis